MPTLKEADFPELVSNDVHLAIAASWTSDVLAAARRIIENDGAVPVNSETIVAVAQVIATTHAALVNRAKR